MARGKQIRTQTVVSQAGPHAGQPADLDEEITLLRGLIAELGERAQDDPRTGELLRLADGVGRACSRLASLLKTQRQLSESVDPAEAMTRVMEQAMRHIGA